jgi:hypothetical protein
MLLVVLLVVLLLRLQVMEGMVEMPTARIAMTARL